MTGVQTCALPILVILEKFYGSKNPTDMLTKGVTIKKLKLCTASVGLLA